ncbi:MAG: glycosyltransferase [Brumimicrobium sp.]|nr:glycosyltransferase [Brumimicrobium sp.]
MLISPLNWGLGHITRTIPVIDFLKRKNNEVMICCDAQQEKVYRNYFPDLWYIPHEGYPFRFKGDGNWNKEMLRNIFGLSSFMAEEKKRVEILISKFFPDLIISDQRFGFRSSKVKSVIISHQLNLPVPAWNIIGKKWNETLLSKFDEVWIPDFQNRELSGSLSDSKLRNISFLGMCSRFQRDSIDKFIPRKHHFSYLGIVSGPPPYSSRFMEMLIRKFSEQDEACVIIAEKIDHSSINGNEGNITFVESPDHNHFLELILASDTVVSRSGYSTLMDLKATGNRAILIPTPGQFEQEYLADHHAGNDCWNFLSEREFERISLNEVLSLRF